MKAIKADLLVHRSSVVRVLLSAAVSKHLESQIKFPEISAGVS